MTVAEACYDQAISIQPDYADAYWNKALLKILSGDYPTGWALYEWRWQSMQKEHVRKFDQPLWLGDQPLAGKTLLIYPEQGLGDFIQFCRYALLLQTMAGKVIIETPAPLLALLTTLNGEFTLVEQGRPLPDFDLQCPLMSLPYAFKTTLATIPGTTPYLAVDQYKHRWWRERLGEKTAVRIGLVWSGGRGYKNDHNRSIPLKQLVPLLALPLEFHALQKEIRQDDAVVLADFENLHCHQQYLADFTDTAALMAEMDLVISVDTSVAHLAGAIAKPVYILLPFNLDYRWLLDRADSPWYPTATLLRQQRAGDWTGVIAQAVELVKANAWVT